MFRPDGLPATHSLPERTQRRPTMGERREQVELRGDNKYYQGSCSAEEAVPGERQPSEGESQD